MRNSIHRASHISTGMILLTTAQQHVMKESPGAPIREGCEGNLRSPGSEAPTLDCFGEDRSPLSTPPVLAALATSPSSHVQLVQSSLDSFPELVSATTLGPVTPSESPTKDELVSAPDIIDSSTPSPASRAPFVRGHRRRSTHVSRHDLEQFRKDVLGIEPPTGIRLEEEGNIRRRINPSVDPEFEDLNRAFESANMSLNSSGGMTSNSPGSSMFSSYVENNAGPPNMPNVPRQSMSPAMPHTPGQVNGGGMPGMNAGIPMNAGHQMDLHHLYDMVLELSDVLKNNREMTKNIVTSAEEIMRRSSSDGASPNMQQVNGEITAARIADLERALAKEKRIVEVLKNEQAENTKLIGEYEAAVGTMVEQIRNYCQNNNMQYLAQKRHYNSLLQAERDSHLESRLDRDHWHAQTMKCAEMIRTAYRLRCEEEVVPLRIVAGLQNEVRAYRHALGMEPEKPEEEYGWELLKDVPGGLD
ncbi:hypothetical protein BDW42DRAFT_156451 [Aspergillus taichungensis]|uniref:Uncharacterized protein n=1 Tax=Aspergillus taichungensis TaxID=482145 RepID=A0A2J5HKF8_9EURO|nr:hypothetical protein BDW42DRAFT_156451 [Aspergillus taichungensis]